MGKGNINRGDIVTMPGIEGDFVVCDADDESPLITVRQLTSHPGMGKPVKVSRHKVKVTHRAIPISQVSLFERG